jgi:hypothetical protein
MKPRSPDDPRCFPSTDCFFHAGFGKWRGSWSSSGDDDRRKFHNMSREFLMESSRERAREMAVFAVVVVAAIWPVIYMVVIVIRVLLKGHPLN